MDALNTLTTLLFVVFAFLFTIFSFICFYIHKKHRQFMHIPSPKRPSFFFGHAPQVSEKVKKGQLMGSVFLEWSLDCESLTYHVFFAHIPIVFTCDPDAVKFALTSGHLNKARKTYQIVHSLFGQRYLGHGLPAETNYSKWHMRRAVVNPAFSRSHLKKMMSVFNEVGDKLMGRLMDGADGTTEADILPLLHSTTLDIIAKVAFGQDLNPLDKDSDSPFHHAVSVSLEGLGYVTRHPLNWIRFWADSLFKSEVRAACLFLRQTCHSWICERQKTQDVSNESNDMLDLMIAAMDEGKPVLMENLVDDMMTLFIAGQETLANMMGFMLCEIGRKPDILHRLREEITSILGERTEVMYSDLGQLPYLTSVMKETLRMYTLAPFTFRESNGKDKITGYDVPRGTTIYVGFYASSHHPHLVEDPDTFLPERFLNDNHKSRPSPYSYMPFSIGPQACIGQTFAQIQGKVMLVKFLQMFNMRLTDDKPIRMEEGTTSRPAGGVACMLSPRE